MSFFKNTFFTTIFVAAICLSLLMGVLQYLQHFMLQQYVASHQQSSALVIASVKQLSGSAAVSSRLISQLEQLPGWRAGIYDRDGQLQWQSEKQFLLPMTDQQRTEIKKQPLTSIDVMGEQEWVTSYYPLDESFSKFISLSSPLLPVHGQIQFVTNLILAVAIITGLILWFVLRMNGRYLRSEIRSYIRNHRKELTRDKLTGLLNREILLDRIEHGLAQAKRQQKRVAVIYMGLSRFKSINETFGHAFGDQALRTLATRLLSASRESDTLVRIEGDEFALLMTGITHQEEVEQVAKRIINALQTPIELGSKQCSLSASLGIAMDEHYSDEADTLLWNAYAAMKELKKQGGSNSYHFFVQGMHSYSLQRAEKEAELYKALDNEEFRLYYQPKVDAVTGAIKGMEALIRWQHPQRGMVSPLEFIPVLEESGLIVMVGEWVLREACRVNKAWQEQGFPALKVAVNVSSIQFREDGFVDMLRDVLQTSGLAPEYLEIEMTESCLMSDDNQIITLLDEIKGLGISISVDDFGTGYSSLSYLKRFPIDTLKIDRSFITNVHDRTANDNAAIVTAIMALSHSLRLEVVAEGVETPQELAYLHALGCRTIQGFLFSHPLSEEEFTSLQQDSISLKQTLESVRQALSH